LSINRIVLCWTCIKFHVTFHLPTANALFCKLIAFHLQIQLVSAFAYTIFRELLNVLYNASKTEALKDGKVTIFTQHLHLIIRVDVYTPVCMLKYSKD